MAALFVSPQIFWETFVFLFLFCGALQAVAQCWFFIKFTRSPWHGFHYVVYIVLLYAVAAVEMELQPPQLVKFFMECLCGFAFLVAAFKSPVPLAALAVVLSHVVLLLTFGILDSVQILAFQWLRSDWLLFRAGYFLLPPLKLLACFWIYRYLVDRYQIAAYGDRRTLLVAFAPIFVIALCVGVVFDLEYTVMTLDETGKRIPHVFGEWSVLFFMLAAALSIAATLYAYKKMTDHIAEENRRLLQEQACEMQRVYMDELRERYQATQVFRHDAKNHLLVLRGLLERGEIAAAEIYLGQTEQAAARLFFDVRTGRASLDALLSHKLGAARAIDAEVECALRIPEAFAAADYDLCVIFSNAVDNAIKACAAMRLGKRYIRLTSRIQGKFLLIAIENSRAQDGAFAAGSGLGLKNIRSVAAKYQGAVSAEAIGNKYSLQILLCISLQETDCS